MSTFRFKIDNPIDKRKEIANKILSAYTDRVPIIVEPNPRTGKPCINKQKFLAPAEISLSKFLNEIRKHITEVSPNSAIYLLTERNIVPCQSESLSRLFQQYADEDGFLYLHCCEENTFGSINI